MANLTILFGALAESVQKQIEDQGYSISKQDAKHTDELIRAVSFLRIHGILTRSQVTSAENKILQKIILYIRGDVRRKKEETMKNLTKGVTPNGKNKLYPTDFFKDLQAAQQECNKRADCDGCVFEGDNFECVLVNAVSPINPSKWNLRRLQNRMIKLRERQCTETDNFLDNIEIE